MSINEEIGRGVRGYREGMGLSQSELVAYMAEEGFRWSQNTVWLVEQGKRPLRYSEAIALTKIFVLPLNAFDPAATIYADAISASEAMRKIKKARLALQVAEKELAQLWGEGRWV